MIVFEGPDGGGKTTLAKSFASLSGLPIAERVVSKEAQALVDLKAWTEDNLNQGFQEKIFDRHRMVSEFVYGPILRAEMEPGFDNMLWVWNQMSKLYALRPIIVYSIPPIETVHINLADDPDNQEVAEWASQIYTAYLQRATIDMLNHPETVLWHDYTDGSPEGHYEGLILGMLADRLNGGNK